MLGQGERSGAGAAGGLAAPEMPAKTGESCWFQGAAELG
jgi:hypothetical protein